MGSVDNICSICLYRIVPRTRVITQCEHEFHHACLELWVVSSTIETHRAGPLANILTLADGSTNLGREPLNLGHWRWTCPVCRCAYSHLPEIDGEDTNAMALCPLAIARSTEFQSVDIITQDSNRVLRFQGSVTHSHYQSFSYSLIFDTEILCFGRSSDVDIAYTLATPCCLCCSGW